MGFNSGFKGLNYTRIVSVWWTEMLLLFRYLVAAIQVSRCPA